MSECLDEVATPYIIPHTVRLGSRASPTLASAELRRRDRHHSIGRRPQETALLQPLGAGAVWPHPGSDKLQLQAYSSRW